MTFISFIVSSRVPRASVLNEPGCSCRFANEGDTVFECLGRIQFGLDGEILMIKKVKSGKLRREMASHCWGDDLVFAVYPWRAPLDSTAIACEPAAPVLPAIPPRTADKINTRSVNRDSKAVGQFVGASLLLWISASRLRRIDRRERRANVVKKTTQAMKKILLPAPDHSIWKTFGVVMCGA